MRNISISYASGDWILILDADEELINYDKLKEFLIQITTQSSTVQQ